MPRVVRGLPGALALASVVLLSALPAAVASPHATAPHPRPLIVVPDDPRPDARVFVLGDSLTLGTLIYGSPSHLVNAARDDGLALTPRPNARVGRRVGEGLAILSHVGAHRTVLIALGTNDLSATSAQAASWIRTARRLAGPTATIFWVNLRLTGAQFRFQTRVNAGLLAGVRRDRTAQELVGATGRAYVLDWSRYAQLHRIANGRDGIHYSPLNYAKRADFYTGCIAGVASFHAYVLR